ncbi:MAG: DUF2092 domain-containing protein [Nocardiopsaceae bacterium]|nr:DUF2092 domain-containing protein [Nocardiopsaceae bacterium]
MKFSNRVRWAVPVAAVAVTGAAVAAATIPTADAAPVLPAKTPAQLLADVAGPHTVPALTGTVVETTSLGLPQLPRAADGMSLASLLTGSHTVKVYWQDAKHFRLALPQSLSETDFIRNGDTGWLWQSGQNTAIKFAPDNSKKISGDARKAAASAEDRAASAKAKAKAEAGKMPDTAPLTPQQAASEILAQVGKTTVVTTQSNVDVANQAAYQLVLAPKDSRSTIGSIRIAVDGKTGVPLRLQVFPKGGTAPAFQVGYTSIDYTAPSASNFNFTPPSGAKVTTPEAAASGSRAGQAGPSSAPDAKGAGAYGTGWLTVAEFPVSDLPGTSGKAEPAPSSSKSTGNPLGGDSQQVLSTILGSAKPVSGAWGSGRLLHTSLLNILITGDKVYLGAVDPSVLEAAVGHPVTSHDPAAG